MAATKTGEQVPQNLVPPSDLNSTFHTNLKAQWQRHFENAPTGTYYKTFQPRVQKNNWFTSVTNRGFIKTLSRIRSDHALCKKYKHKKGLAEDPYCTYGEVEDMQRIILECPQYQNQRSHFYQEVLKIGTCLPVNLVTLLTTQDIHVYYCLYNYMKEIDIKDVPKCHVQTKGADSLAYFMTKSSYKHRYFAQIWNIDYAMGFTLLGMLNGFKNLLDELAFGSQKKIKNLRRRRRATNKFHTKSFEIVTSKLQFIVPELSDGDFELVVGLGLQGHFKVNHGFSYGICIIFLTPEMKRAENFTFSRSDKTSSNSFSLTLGSLARSKYKTFTIGLTHKECDIY
ncbi:hypothetical protein NQ315_016202 [Exocentrus adspersus]|uniref:Reverse transcriptase n=1 Tax=Exocentrus adspersus TaxID=1586481 RepID=A0AAV8VJZ2_9CUCU|nr:hypothetical protein NQ315_016202 [Exocentrus adspersus]